MGSYATLKIDGREIESYKSYLPFESLLYFLQQDLVVFDLDLDSDEYNDLDDTEEEFHGYKFITTIAQARKRLDLRGIDLNLCRSLYNTYRSETFTVVQIIPAKDVQEGKKEGAPYKFLRHSVANLFSYDDYMQLLKEKIAGNNFRTRHAFDEIREEKGDSTENLEMPSGLESLFTGESTGYFTDVIALIHNRTILELFSDDTLVELDITDLVLSEYIAKEEIETIIAHYTQLFLSRIEIDYKVYGFVLNDDPIIENRLRSKIDSMDENQFISYVLLPLLKAMGFEHVQKVSFHGHGEFGADIRPFRKETPFNTYEYLALQAKAKTIHGTSSKSGNAAEIFSQIRQAFAVAFVDDLDNERKHIDKFIVATSKDIKADARIYIESELESKRAIIFLDIDKIIELLKKFKLVHYVLFTQID